ncbi:MAG TPA: TIGR02147 family protein [Fibrobacteria bacterium]|nr:TIGR02147 family protein [Fibrobacteria bacterium]
MTTVFEYLDYRKYLKDVFEERKADDPHLSYRTMAEALGLDGSNFYKILQGRTHLPVRCQSRVLEFLGLSGRPAEYFLLLVAHSRERGARARLEILERARQLHDVARRPLEDRELLFYRDWWVSVVRSLLDVHDGRAIPEEIASSVSPAITPADARAAMELLADLGLIKKTVSGKWKLADAHVTAGGEKKAQAVHAYQRQILQLASESLHRHPKEERDISTLTIPVDENSFQAIAKILRESRRQIQKQAEATSKPTRVMQLAMMLFPVSSPSEVRR